MITAEPSASNTDVGWPLTSEIAGLATSTASTPLGGTCRLGMSPAWGPSAAAMPCFAPPGLKCPPALVKGGSHLPTAWTWKACSPAGMPFTDSLSSTPCGVWTRSTVPTSLPLLSLRTAFAVSAWAEIAAAQAIPSTAMNRLNRIVPPWSSLRQNIQPAPHLVDRQVRTSPVVPLVRQVLVDLRAALDGSEQALGHPRLAQHADRSEVLVARPHVHAGAEDHHREQHDVDRPRAHEAGGESGDLDLAFRIGAVIAQQVAEIVPQARLGEALALARQAEAVLVVEGDQ